MPERKKKPRVFIGSSQEGHLVAEYIQLGLDDVAECTTWSQGVFGLSKPSSESLSHATRNFDFAVLVLTPDDLNLTRGKKQKVPRDNVVFELGLFMGALGANKTFIVMPRDEKIDLPSDLEGVTTARYASRRDGNLRAAMGPVCTLLKEEMYRSDNLSPSPPAHQLTPACKNLVSRRRRRKSLGIAHINFQEDPCRIVDISTSGALLETQGEIAVGKLLDLSLGLENGECVAVTAKVVRIQYPAWGCAGGVAVSFPKLAGRALAVIGDYVDADPVRLSAP